MTMNTYTTDTLRSRAQALRLNGLVEHWSEVDGAEWVAPLIQWEEDRQENVWVPGGSGRFPSA
ncbi:hypothetical protein D9M68_136070 [compost metagenome]